MDRRTFVKVIGVASITPILAFTTSCASSPKEDSKKAAIKDALVGKWQCKTKYDVTWTFRFNEDGTFEAGADSGGKSHNKGNYTIDDDGFIHLDTMEDWVFYIKNDDELWMLNSDGDGKPSISKDWKFAKVVE